MAGSLVNVSLVATRDGQYLRRLKRDDAPSRTGFAIVQLAGPLAVSILYVMSGDGRAVLAGLLNLWLMAITLRLLWSPFRRGDGDWPAYYLEPNIIAITEDGVTLSSAVTTGWFAWSAVTRVEERPYAFLLFVNRSTHRDVPRSGLTSEQDDELRRFLVGRGLLDGVPERRNRSHETSPP